jgi:hypothetical protein
MDLAGSLIEWLGEPRRPEVTSQARKLADLVQQFDADAKFATTAAD